MNISIWNQFQTTSLGSSSSSTGINSSIRHYSSSAQEVWRQFTEQGTLKDPALWSTKDNQNRASSSSSSSWWDADVHATTSKEGGARTGGDGDSVSDCYGEEGLMKERIVERIDLPARKSQPREAIAAAVCQQVTYV